MTTLTNQSVKQASDHPLRKVASKTGRFLLHLLEMLVAMQVGMMLFHLLLGLIRIASNSRVLESGTTLHAITMTVFMTIPMVAWMIFRGHGWRHCIEMVVAMIAPVVVIGLLCQLGVDAYVPWLVAASMPAMLLGMVAAMLYRKDHYMDKAKHFTHPAQTEAEVACHTN